MKIGNKILIVIIAVIGLYAAILIATDINTISSKISDFKIETIPVIVLLVTSGCLCYFLDGICYCETQKYSSQQKIVF